MTRRNLPGLVETAGRLGMVALVLVGAVSFADRTEGAAVVWVAGLFPSALVSLMLAGIPRPKLTHRHKVREYFSFGWRTTIAQVLQKQLQWVGTAAVYLAYLGVSLDEAQTQAGLFRTAYALMFYMVVVGGSIPGMLYPMLSRAFAEKDAEAGRKEAHRLISLAFYYELLLIVPIATGLVLVGPWAFATLLPAFVPAGPLTQLLAFSGLLFCLTFPPAVALPAAGRPELVLRLFLLQLVIAAALNALLVPQLGAPWGGSVGAIIADWATAAAGLVYSLVLVKRIGVPLPSLAVARKALAAPPKAPPA